MIVPGGGISLDGERWVACRKGFFLPVRVLSCLFRRLFLEKLMALHDAGGLKFFGDHVALAGAQAFAAYLVPLRRTEWVVYAKRPFGGQSRSRNSAQGVKWNFCLTAGTLCLRIRSDHEQTSPPEPHTGLQGKGGACRRQG